MLTTNSRYAAQPKQGQSVVHTARETICAHPADGQTFVLAIVCLQGPTCCALLCHAQVPANVREARDWIANWRAKQGKGGAPPPSSSSSSSKPAATPKAVSSGSSGSNGAPVPPNVQEAREWIAQWRAKQGIGSGAAAGGAESTATAAQQQDGGDVQVMEGEDIMASVTRFFQGFGGNK
jgi:hypothetical protein